MEKRSKKKEERSGKESDQLLAVSIQPEAPAEEERQELYTVGLWKGLKQFRCVKCPFDTLSEEAMFRHAQAHLPKQQPPRKPSVLVADKRGNERDFTLTPELSPLQGEGDSDVFEVELKEIDSTVDGDGNVHKTFTVKE